MAKRQKKPVAQNDVFATAMRAFDFDLSLVNAKQSPEVQREAVRSLLDKFFLSSILLLPSPGKAVEETQRLFKEALERLHKTSQVLAQ